MRGREGGYVINEATTFARTVAMNWLLVQKRAVRFNAKVFA